MVIDKHILVSLHKGFELLAEGSLAVILCITVGNILSCDSRQRQLKEETAGLTSNLPRLGFNLPDKTFNAVDLPIPLVPTSPSTYSYVQHWFLFNLPCMLIP